MSNATIGDVLRHLRHLADTGGAVDLTDGELLERFRIQREEAAFAVLVQRLGPLVLGVCRRVLGNIAEVEDAFQATFLVLVKRAAAVRKQDSLASFLHGVAYRVAMKARNQTGTRRALEQRATEHMESTQSTDDRDWQELRGILDEEISRLPDECRVPVVMCYLQGKTQTEAAQLLGCPRSSLASRLERARKRLRQQLTRRGVTVGAALLAGVLGSQADAAVPARLLLATTQIAKMMAAGKSAGTVAAAPAVILAENMVKTMVMSKLKLVLIVGVAISLLAAGTSVLALSSGLLPPQSTTAPPAKGTGEQPLTDKPDAAQPNHSVSHLPEGAIARLGSLSLRHNNAVSAIAFSPDGKFMISGSWDRTVRMWDAESGVELSRFDPPFKDGVSSVAISPDGKLLAAGGMDRTLRLWDLVTKKQIFESPEQENTVISLAFSPDGRSLAAAAASTVHVWAVASQKETMAMNVPRGWMHQIAFSPDGKIIAAGGSDRSIHLWYADSGKPLGDLAGHKDSIYSIAFSPDGKSLVSGGGGRNRELRLWHVPTQKEVRSWTGSEGDNPVAFSPQGGIVACSGPNGTVLLYDVENGSIRRKLAGDGSNTDRIATLAFSPDGKTLAAGAGRTIRRWDVETGTERTPAGHFNQVTTVAFSQNGKLLASAGVDGVICLWDLATKSEKSRLIGHEDRITALTSIPNTGILATSSTDRTIRLWDVTSGKQIKTIPGVETSVDSIAFSPDHKVLATGAWQDHSVRLWDAATGAELVKMSLPRPNGVNEGSIPLAFSPDGKILATGSADRTVDLIFLWNAETGKRIRRVPIPGIGTGSLAFAPDGSTIAAVTSKSLRLLDVANDHLIAEFANDGYGGTCLAFSPDGRLLVAGGDAEHPALRCWEVSSGKLLAALEGHRGGINWVAFSPDGRTLATAGRDTTILLWDVTVLAKGKAAPAGQAKSMEALWADLHSADAPLAHQAILALTAVPDQAVAFLGKRLQPVAAPDKQHLDHLIADLDSTEFTVRERAAKELEALGELASPWLRDAGNSSSAEVRHQAQNLAQNLLDKLNGPIAEGDQLRQIRAVEVLERIASTDARKLLEKLAKGAPPARLTREASSSLKRLEETKR